MTPYYVYILRCRDGSLYTGIATDVARRFREHTEGRGKGAKYTANHTPVRVERVWAAEDRGAASRLEYRIKQLDHTQKERLIAAPGLLSVLIGDKLDCTGYRSVTVSD